MLNLELENDERQKHTQEIIEEHRKTFCNKRRHRMKVKITKADKTIGWQSENVDNIFEVKSVLVKDNGGCFHSVYLNECEVVDDNTEIPAKKEIATEPVYHIGQRFDVKNCGEYMLCQIGEGNVSFINNKGMALTDPNIAINIQNITKADIDNMIANEWKLIDTYRVGQMVRIASTGIEYLLVNVAVGLSLCGDHGETFGTAMKINNIQAITKEELDQIIKEDWEIVS